MKKFASILFALFLCVAAMAQKEMSAWCFGNGVSINTTRTGITHNRNTPMSSVEGCASISDKVSGRLLFFTNGTCVWDSNYALMPSGKGLNGDPQSTEAAVIVPMPCNPTKFYIFTTNAQAGYLSGGHVGLCYSIVDMTANSGNGDVVVKNSQMMDPVCEKLCATFAGNNNDVWVMVHKFNSADFTAFNISSTGITKAVTTTIGSIHRDPLTAPYSGVGAIGAMQFTNDGKYIAVASSYSNTLEIFQFDKNSGSLLRVVAKDTFFLPKNGPYGLCFSQDNSKLYMTTVKGDALYQYDMGAPNISLSKQPIAIDTTDVLGQMQLGLDGKIYVSRLDRSAIGVINYPNMKAKSVGFARGALALGKSKSMLGMPNFISNYTAPLVSQKVYYKNCDKLDSLTYTVLPVHVKGRYSWHFGDSLSGKADSSALTQPTHIFSSSGYHQIRLSLSGCNYSDTFSRTVVVSPHPFSMTINSNNIAFNNKTVSLCPGGYVTFHATGAPPGFKFQWLVNRVKVCSCDSVFLMPDKSEAAIVQSGMGTPCFNSDTVYVVFHPKPVATAIQNAGACIHGSTKLWAAGGVAYRWIPDRNLDSAAIDTPVFHAETPMTYSIVVTDQYGCKDTTTTSVEVYNTVFAEAGNDLLTDEMGVVQLHGNSNGVSFTWTPDTGISNNHILTPTITIDQTTLYHLYAIDSHGCKATDSVWVHVNRTPSLFVTNAFTPNSDGINDEFKVFTHNITQIHLRIYNRLGNLIYESSSLPAKWDGRFNGILQPEGTYFYDIEANTYQGSTLVKHGDVALIH